MVKLPTEDANELEEYVAAICEILRPHICERQVDPIYHLALTALVDVVHDLRGDCDERTLVVNYKDFGLKEPH
jgi:hypothetical protein